LECSGPALALGHMVFALFRVSGIFAPLSTGLPQGNVRKHYMGKSRKDNLRRVYSAGAKFAAMISNYSA
jgi:hypothetical protein